MRALVRTFVELPVGVIGLAAAGHLVGTLSAGCGRDRGVGQECP